jgi:threonine dehydrogenase-like Zn-dependent dehydrogenase
VSNTYKLTNPQSIGKTLGHEAIGEVVEVGNKVKDFKPGDRVLVPSITPDYMFTYDHQILPCGQHSGGMLDGYKFTSETEGVFSEYFSVIEADQNLALIPEGVSDRQAIMIVDMMNTGFYGAELADIQFGDTVVVYGIGPVGLMAVAGARLRGAGRIIAIGNRPITQEIAKLYGATDLVDYKVGPVTKQVKTLTNGKGVDKVIVAGGTLEAIGDGMRMLKPHGKVANIVYFATSGKLEIPLNSWGFGMANKDLVSGCCPGGRARMERLALMVQNQMVDPAHLITHTFNGIDRIEEAFEMMHDHPRDLIKPVVFI